MQDFWFRTNKDGQEWKVSFKNNLFSEGVDWSKFQLYGKNEPIKNKEEFTKMFDYKKYLI